MPNMTVTSDKIVVHGRGSVVIDYKVTDTAGTQVDISALPLFFEVDGVPIREPLVADPNDPLGRRIVLEREQVESLKTSLSRFAVIDESDAAQDVYIVLWDGMISRTAYIHDPDTAEG